MFSFFFVEKCCLIPCEINMKICFCNVTHSSFVYPIRFSFFLFYYSFEASVNKLFFSLCTLFSYILQQKSFFSHESFDRWKETKTRKIGEGKKGFKALQSVQKQTGAKVKEIGKKLSGGNKLSHCKRNTIPGMKS